MYSYNDWKDDQILIAKLIKAGEKIRAYDHLQTIQILIASESIESMICRVISNQASGMLLMWDILNPKMRKTYKAYKEV